MAKLVNAPDLESGGVPLTRTTPLRVRTPSAASTVTTLRKVRSSPLNLTFWRHLVNKWIVGHK